MVEMKYGMFINQPRTEKGIGNPSKDNNFITNYDENALRRIRSDFKPKASDVHVVTYPKCGTTWTCTIVDHLLKQTTPGIATGFSLNSCPWLDMLAQLENIEELSWKKALDYFETMKSPRVFKSHSTVDLVVHPAATKARII